MSLTKLDNIIDIDVEQNIVKCQAGARIHDLFADLDPHKLAIGTLGTIDWQTISGAVTTGTHCNLLITHEYHNMHIFHLH